MSQVIKVFGEEQGIAEVKVHVIVIGTGVVVTVALMTDEDDLFAAATIANPDLAGMGLDYINETMIPLALDAAKRSVGLDTE